MLGWTPQLKLSDAILLTGLWYKTQIDGGDVAALTRQQIKDYLGQA